jgi:hypothetical protein
MSRKDGAAKAKHWRRDDEDYIKEICSATVKAIYNASTDGDTVIRSEAVLSALLSVVAAVVAADAEKPPNEAADIISKRLVELIELNCGPLNPFWPAAAD